MMAGYEREIAQALREIAQEMRHIRRTLEGLDRRLATPGGLTAATTRRAHLIVDGDKKKVYCSACGCTHGKWYDDIDTTLANYGEICGICGAGLRGDEEYASGSESE